MSASAAILSLYFMGEQDANVVEQIIEYGKQGPQTLLVGIEILSNMASEVDILLIEARTKMKIKTGLQSKFQLILDYFNDILSSEMESDFRVRGATLTGIKWFARIKLPVLFHQNLILKVLSYLDIPDLMDTVFEIISEAVQNNNYANILSHSTAEQAAKTLPPFVRDVIYSLVELLGGKLYDKFLSEYNENFSSVFCKGYVEVFTELSRNFCIYALDVHFLSLRMPSYL